MAKRTNAERRDAEALAALERFGGAPLGGHGPARTMPDDARKLELATRAPRKNPSVLTKNKDAAPQVPRWYRAAVPVLFSAGGLLVIIGLWAVGAMVYMHTVTPSGPDFEIQYPLVRWSADLGDAGGYTPESKWMAMIMLACLPVAAIMGAIVLLMRRQMRMVAGGGRGG